MTDDFPDWRYTLRFWRAILWRTAKWTWAHPVISLGGPLFLLLASLPLLWAYAKVFGKPEAMAAFHGLLLASGGFGVVTAIIFLWGLLRFGAERSLVAADDARKRAEVAIARAEAREAQAEKAKVDLETLRDTEALYCGLSNLKREVVEFAEALGHNLGTNALLEGLPVPLPRETLAFQRRFNKLLQNTPWVSTNSGDPMRGMSPMGQVRYVRKDLLPAIESVIERLPKTGNH